VKLGGLFKDYSAVQEIVRKRICWRGKF